MKKISIGWGLTKSCNMHCDFCYSKDARGELLDIGIQDWKNFVDRNHEYIDSINYGTGENAIMDDFFYFIQYIRQHYPEIKQSLTSNGYVGVKVEQNPLFKKIYEESIDEIDVSIDYNDQDKHNKQRGHVQAFEWANKTLQMSKEMGKLCTVVFVGSDDTCTKENLAGLFELVKKYDALLRMNIYRPVSKDKKNDRFILSYKGLKDTLQYVNDTHEIVSLSDKLLGNVFTDQVNICDNTGTESIRILPDGTICPSTYLIDAKYRNNANIKTANLATLNFPQFLEVETPKACAGCEIEKSCKGGVFDRRILWYDTFAERDPYCPTRNNDTIPVEKFHVEKLSRISVHDGYLPTLFFKAKDVNDEETAHKW